MQTLADSDSDKAEFEQDYTLSSDTDTESEQSSASDNEDRPRSSGSGSTTSRSRSRRGRVPQTADSGDGFVDDGWSRNFVAPTVDLNFNEDGYGPVNLPESLTEESSCVAFLSLCADENFWQNLTAMTNIWAHQTLAAKPNNGSTDARTRTRCSGEHRHSTLDMWDGESVASACHGPVLQFCDPCKVCLH